MEKVLTKELIVMKTKANQIDRISKLNLWGQDISDITIVNEMVGL